DAAIAECWCRARTGARIRFPETSPVAVSPHQLARSHVMTRDVLVVTALFLGIEAPVVDREGRPAWSNGPPPHFHRRRRSPISFDPHTMNNAVAFRSAKAGPVGVRFSCCGRNCGSGLLAGLGQEQLLRSLGPPPVEIVIELCGKTAGPDYHKQSA